MGQKSGNTLGQAGEEPANESIVSNMNSKIPKFISLIFGFLILVLASFLGGAFFSSLDDNDNPPTVAPESTRDELAGRDGATQNTRVPIATAFPTADATKPPPTVTPIPTLNIGEINRTGIVESDTVIIRACPYISCESVGQATTRLPLLVTGIVINGESIEGVTNWYRVQFGGGLAYVHSSFMNLLSDELAVATTELISTPMPELPTLPPHQWDCTGNNYNCSAFDNRETLMSYFNSCPGDPSGLDRNKDGVPCESIP